MQASFPVASANSQAAWTFGPIEPAGKEYFLSSPMETVFSARASGVPQPT